MLLTFETLIVASHSHLRDKIIVNISVLLVSSSTVLVSLLIGMLILGTSNVLLLVVIWIVLLNRLLLFLVTSLERPLLLLSLVYTPVCFRFLILLWW